MQQSYIYIMTNKKEGTLYVGVTSDLIKRVYQHKEGITGGFTSKYNLQKLVYFEVFEDIKEAILREKKLKKYFRFQKLELIKKFNPDWSDLYEQITA